MLYKEVEPVIKIMSLVLRIVSKTLTCITFALKSKDLFYFGMFYFWIPWIL